MAEAMSLDYRGPAAGRLPADITRNAVSNTSNVAVVAEDGIAEDRLVENHQLRNRTFPRRPRPIGTHPTTCGDTRNDG
jgi:hypothetical protein